jgi:hypothetical protein
VIKSLRRHGSFGCNLLSFYIYVFSDVVFHVKQFDNVMLNVIS